MSFGWPTFIFKNWNSFELEIYGKFSIRRFFPLVFVLVIDSKIDFQIKKMLTFTLIIYRINVSHIITECVLPTGWWCPSFLCFVIRTWAENKIAFSIISLVFVYFTIYTWFFFVFLDNFFALSEQFYVLAKGLLVLVPTKFLFLIIAVEASDSETNLLLVLLFFFAVSSNNPWASKCKYCLTKFSEKCTCFSFWL